MEGSGVTVTEEDVDEMMSVIKMGGGVTGGVSDAELRRWVRHKLQEGKVPCFEQMKWVPKEKTE